MKIYNRNNEDINELIRKFKKSVQSAGILQECKKREFYRNPREMRIFKEQNRRKKRSK